MLQPEAAFHHNAESPRLYLLFVGIFALTQSFCKPCHDGALCRSWVQSFYEPTRKHRPHCGVSTWLFDS